jgi:hypothetical protein
MSTGPVQPSAGTRHLMGPSTPDTAPTGPVEEAPTSSLSAVSEPPSGRAPAGRGDHPPVPPARPRFEFRPPPSAVCEPRPQALTLSSLLWAGAAAALVLAVVLPLVGVGDLWADVTTAVNTGFPNEAETTRDRAAAVASFVLVGSGVLFALLAGGSAAAMRRGKPTARIVLALLLVLIAVHALLMIGVAPLASTVLLGAAVALALVATVLMFLPGTTAWLTRPRRS